MHIWCKNISPWQRSHFFLCAMTFIFWNEWAIRALAAFHVHCCVTLFSLSMFPFLKELKWLKVTLCPLELEFLLNLLLYKENILKVINYLDISKMLARNINQRKIPILSIMIYQISNDHRDYERNEKKLTHHLEARKMKLCLRLHGAFHCRSLTLSGTIFVSTTIKRRNLPH